MPVLASFLFLFLFFLQTHSLPYNADAATAQVYKAKIEDGCLFASIIVLEMAICFHYLSSVMHRRNLRWMAFASIIFLVLEEYESLAKPNCSN